MSTPTEKMLITAKKAKEHRVIPENNGDVLLENYYQDQVRAFLGPVHIPSSEERAKMDQERIERDETRLRQMLFAKQKRDSQCKREKQAAEEMFVSQTGLIEKINTTVLPNVVSLSVSNGERLGTGFFQHGSWLVLNAHVMPLPELISETRITDHHNQSRNLTAIQAFHRPDENKAPDIVVINSASDDPEAHKGLPTDFNDDRDHKGRIYFYTYFNNRTHEPMIKFVQPCSKPGKLPLTFVPLDGVTPPEGCSGAPVIEGRVVRGHEPSWQFKVIGAVYARCSDIMTIGDELVNPASMDVQNKLLCAIPISQEFNQILSILQGQEKTSRYKHRAEISSLLGDRDKAEEEKRQSQISAEKVASEFRAFEAGVTPLNIDLLPGLEKLWYSGVVRIAASLLIPSVCESETGKSVKQLGIENTASFQQLYEDFQSFILFIKKLENIILSTSDNFFNGAGSQYFRADIREESKGWKIDIQDNTGLNNDGKPLQCRGKSLSSVFARVYLPPRNSSIKGERLVDLLNQSQFGSEECSLHMVPIDKIPDFQNDIIQGKKIAVVKVKEQCKIFYKKVKTDAIESFICSKALAKMLSPLVFGDPILVRDRDHRTEEIYKLVYQAVASQGGYIPSSDIQPRVIDTTEETQHKKLKQGKKK